MPHGTIGAVGVSRLNAPAPYRVAVVAPCPFPSLRGSQVLIRELAERLGDLGHAVHVVTYPSAEHLVPVRRIAIHRVAKIPGLWTTRPLGWQKLALDLLLLWLLLRVVRRQRIQVIHAHNLEGPIIAYIVRWLTGVPVVYHAHNALSDELPCYASSRPGRRIAAAIGAFLDRHIAAAADYSIALTDRLAAFLAVRGAAGRVTVVPPAVRTARVNERLPVRKRSGPEIAYAGNLDPYQDLGVLLEAFERVRTAEPHATLVLVTHTSAHRRTLQRARALAARAGVTMRSVSTFAAAARELRSADVVVCPRGTWSGFPIKVLNYMALGRPIVHARASAHPIEDGVTGLVFANDDPRALAQAIVRLLRDPELSARLSRQARSVVREQYSWSRVIPRILSVYGRVLVLPRQRPFGPQRQPEEVSMEERVRRLFPAARKDTLTRHLVLALTAGLMLGGLIGCGAKQPEAVAPLPPLGAPAATGLPEVSPLYRLQAYDTVRVKFLYHPELDTKVPITPDGALNLSGVGEFQAAGKTTEQLAREIKTVSSDRLRDPEVEVIVAELGRYKVWVFGEVRSPGEVPYREGMTPLQVIGDRGGFTDYARAESVLRITPDGTATKVDLTGNLPDTITVVEANEVIYVPRTGVGDAVAFMRTFRNLLPIQPRFGIGYGID